MLMAIESADEQLSGLRKVILCCAALLAVAAVNSSAFGQEDMTRAVADDAQDESSSNAESVPDTQLVTLDDTLTDAQLSNLRKLEFFTYLWILTLGSTIGSFLNVVIYRLPAGRSLNGDSMCPGCDQRIQWRDNIPVIGWIKLRGRCRNCNIRIPFRYPAVEALIASWFAVLLAIELLSGGDNLPVRVPNTYDGVVWIIWYTKWDLIGIYLFHCILGCLVIAAALMQWDGHALPRRFTCFLVGVSLLAPTFWKHLHPVSFHEPWCAWLSEHWRWQTSFVDPVSGWTQNFGVGLDGFADSIAGLVVGLLAGWLVARCLGRGAFPDATSPFSNASQDAVKDGRRQHTRSFCVLFGAVVAFLGWQSAAPLAIGASVFALVLAAVSKFTGDARWQRQMSNGSIAAATLLLIPLWRTFSKVDAFPDHTGWPAVAKTSWWPLSSCEPYASLLLAIAVGCMIAKGHFLFANANVDQSDIHAGESRPDSTSIGA